MPDIPFPRGMRDLLPNQALFRNELLKKIESVFQRYGFLTIDTPMLESIKVLKAKGGIGEDTKLIFETTEDELGLRYDLTVSLARYVGMHQELPLPFKRYAIGKSWRREEPQRLRYREFTQADVDIVGGNTALADAEVICTVATALDELGVGYFIRINSRVMMDSLLAAFGVKKEQFMDVLRIVDKLDKQGRDKVAEMLSSMGLEKETVRRIDDIINMQGSNAEKLNFAESVVKDKSSADISTTLGFAAAYGIKGDIRVDFSVVRGFDYYTGTVFEFMDAGGEKSSLGGGGRYDGLVGLYSGRSVPATGASLGIDRILELMGFSSSTKYTYAKLFVINVKDSNYGYALKMANWFRSRGIATDINLSTRNISNQLSYANSLSFPYAVIVGDAEEKEGKVKLRNLTSGDETTVTAEEALATVGNG
jgi:histidyl-tRNA synthetase